MSETGLAGHPDDLHVIPNEDFIEHPISANCVCGPTPETPSEGGPSIYLHHPLDGREFAERGEEIPRDRV